MTRVSRARGWPSRADSVRPVAATSQEPSTRGGRGPRPSSGFSGWRTRMKGTGQFAAVLLALAAHAGVGGEEPPTAIVGADVLTMAAAGRVKDAVVIVQGDRIVAVGPRGTTPVPP